MWQLVSPMTTKIGNVGVVVRKAKTTIKQKERQSGSCRCDYTATSSITAIVHTDIISHLRTLIAHCTLQSVHDAITVLEQQSLMKPQMVYTV